MLRIFERTAHLLVDCATPAPPPTNAMAMVTAINAAFSRLPPTSELIWFRHRWSQMLPEQQYRWVERRIAPLLIIWTRGGRSGFLGLGAELDEAMHLIDR
ncbi:hypothetical protein [Shimia sp. R9_1]|uniref:hypothetical protein n=1 Tax=Shimia sp. R9_1 TaxID=2821111 RepID=UPI001AD97F61|nr:hypothetical protein [Shimia sp. R9_1]